MEPFEFVDALTGNKVIQDYDTGELFVETSEESSDASQAASEQAESKQAKCVFFPGCSMINYAMPLVDAVYKTLLQHEVVDGISILCCGKILSYEPDGENIRASFEDQLRDHVAELGIERFVCACPNCVKALRDAFERDPRTASVDVAVLPKVLADLGYRLDKQAVGRLIKGDEDADVTLCTHDSCPDREYGEFADGLREVVGEGLWVDPEHCRRKSVCCGSLPRAAGKVAAADKCADTCGREAEAVNADAIVTACMSCAFQLNMAQKYLPAVHFLELLYSWRIDWSSTGLWMKIRFLFDETLGATQRSSEGRTFAGLGSANAKAKSEKLAAEDVALTEDNTVDVEL